MIKFGIIGPGIIANKFAKAVKLTEGVTLQGVASRDLAKAQKFAKEYDAPLAFGSYEELVKCDEIDAVYICVPHNFHADQIRLALNNNKAVFCEKPTFMTTDEANELLTLAKEKNLLFMEAMWTRFLPTMIKVREWVRNQTVGDARLIQANFANKCAYNPEGRLFNKKLAGGALWDVGSYCTLFAMDIANSPIKIANGVAKLGETGVDEVASFSFLFENGIVASMNTALAVQTENNATIYCSDGKIELDSFWQIRKATLFNAKGEVLETVNNPFENGFEYEIAHFRDLMVAGKKESDIMPFSASLESTKANQSLVQMWGIEY